MKIQLLSEGGGIGDVLRRVGVARSIKVAIPDADVWFFAENRLMDWVNLDRSTAYAVSIPTAMRRPINAVPRPELYPYLDIGLPYDYTIDLYDPSELYEDEVLVPITRNRGVTWREVASSILGCPLELQLCKLTTGRLAQRQAQAELHAKFGDDLTFVVGLQPFSYWGWRSLSQDQVRGIVARLRSFGAQCVLFHHTLDGIEELIKELGLATVIDARPAVLTEIIRRCNVVITGDSGFFHIAGMLGVPAVGAFGQTNGTAIGSDYPSCRTITAGPVERDGLTCEVPCYRRSFHGCDRYSCSKECRALTRISPIQIADEALKLAGFLRR